MEFRALKTWHWMLIGLIAGLVVGLLREHQQSEIHGNYIEGFGYFLGDQKRFEDGLLTRIDGRPRFDDITVYPRHIRNAQGESIWVYLVKSLYYGGPPQTIEGRAQGGWQPTCFIAPVPYEPLLDFSTLEKPGSPDWSKNFRAAGLRPTVLDFLAVMHSAADVGFRYVWWDGYPVGSSMLIGFVLFGILWPPVINIVSFGSMSRPPEARALSLWKVRNRPASNSKQQTQSFAASEDVPSSPPPEADRSPAVSSQPVAGSKPFASGEDANHAVFPASAPREFGARDEDFYPTERHLPPG